MDTDEIPENIRVKIDLMKEKTDDEGENIGHMLEWLWENPDQDSIIEAVEEEFELEKLSDKGVLTLTGAIFGVELNKRMDEDREWA